MKISTRGTPAVSALAAGVLAFVGIPVLATPASAAVSDPPSAPHSIIVFPQRDFVSASGFASSDRVTVNVLRGAVVVGTSSDLVPQDDPSTAKFDGLVEVNHPGGGCWEGVTPDIRPGDVVQTLTAPDTGDQTTTADVVVTSPATAPNPGDGTVVVKGTAVTAAGAPIPIDQLEVRLVANKQSFMINGRRTLRADAAGTGEGTVGYDTPGGTTWTATFTGLTQVNKADGLSDETRAVRNETRGMWRGRNPATTAEGTIYEYGQVGGPAAPCTAPLASGPSTPDMTPASDTGTSSTDNITSNPSPPSSE